MSKTYNLLFAGVGGQGSLLIAELTSLAAVQAGYEVKQTEVHGVSQRGGSVETHVRFGDRVYSPMVTPGTADAVICMEKLEALRFAHFLDQEVGMLFVNEHEIIPASVNRAEELYPHEVVSFLLSKGLSVFTLPATRTAQKLGDARMANVVMLGALEPYLPIPPDAWDKTLKMRLPARYLEPNQRAFRAGREFNQRVPVGS